jgi:MFS family permease
MKNDTEIPDRLTKMSPITYYPWVVVVLGALLSVSSNIYINTFGVFFKPIAADFFWNRSTVAAAFAIRALVSAACVIPVGYLADRYGPRRVLLPSFILLGISMMAMSRVTNLWQFYLLQGTGIGIGLAGPFVCIMSTVAKWHDKTRGLALGIASAGTGLSSIIFPPLATVLIEARDWQFAAVMMGLFILIIAIPIAIFMKDPPHLQKTATNGDSVSNGVFDVWSSVPGYLRNPSFVAITIIFILTNTTSQMLSGHLVNFATDIGIAALVAAGMMSAIGIASATGRLGMGAISDKIGTRKDAALCCIFLFLSFTLLMTKIQPLMWIAVVLFGIGSGGMIPLAPALMAERIERDRLSTATGVVTTGIMLGSALGPWLGGFIFDISGSYLWAWITAALAVTTAFFIILQLPAPKPHKSIEV